MKRTLGRSTAILLGFALMAGVAVAAAFLSRRGTRAAWWPANPGLTLARGVVGGASMVAWFYGLAHVPLAEAAARDDPIVRRPGTRLAQVSPSP